MRLRATEDDRRLDVYIAALIGAAAAVALTYAALALSRAPAVADLYDLVYHGTRPTKPESPALFLFVFPTFLSAGALLSLGRALGRWHIPQRFGTIERPSARVALAVLWTAALLAGSLHRSWLVIHHAR